jgi:hypothetical protein
MKVTGTWKLSQQITAYSGQAKVYAHIPDHGAQTSKAEYHIKHAAGETVKAISQDANQSNKWVDLGAYFFTGMTPEVSLDNFNGGDGTADVAWDALAFVPGDYSEIPSDLTFGDPDVNAPDPAQVQPPSTIPGNFLELPGAQALSTKITKAALASGSTEKETATKPVERSTLSATSGGTCSTTTVSMTYTRDTACIVEDIPISQPASGGQPTKIAMFRYVHDIYTDTRSKTVTQKVTISLKSLTGASNTSLDVDFQCRGYCQMETPTKTGSETFTVGDSHQFIIEQKMDWIGTGEQNITPYWILSGKMDGVATASTPQIEKDELTIRCDNTVLPVTPGCVFSWYKPTYTMNSKKFPAAAAHAWLMQNKLPTHFGLKGQGDPLNYLGPDVLKPGTVNTKMSDANRDVICPTGWAKQYSPTLSPELVTSNDDEPSCDEFAFASSYQSAGFRKDWGGKNPAPVTSGDQCINTIATKDPDGMWRLHPVPGTNVPTWTETCGRSAMSSNQNSGSMQPFGVFRNDNRMIDDDAYWLNVPKP